MIREKLARSIIDNVFDVIAIVDENLNIVDINAAIGEIGYGPTVLPGKPLGNLFVDKQSLIVALPELITAANANSRLVKRFEVRRADGSSLWMDITAKEIETENKGKAYLLTMHDVDERARQRKELEEQKAKIESVLQETDRLRKEAEDSKIQLQIANEQLAKRQALTEAALLEEQKIRLNTQKTGFQKSLAYILSGLVLVSVLLPYTSAFFAVPEKVMDSGANFTLILLQILGSVVAYMFGRENNKEKEGNTNG